VQLNKCNKHTVKVVHTEDSSALCLVQTRLQHSSGTIDRTASSRQQRDMSPHSQLSQGVSRTCCPSLCPCRAQAGQCQDQCLVGPCLLLAAAAGSRQDASPQDPRGLDKHSTATGKGAAWSEAFRLYVHSQFNQASICTAALKTIGVDNHGAGQSATYETTATELTQVSASAKSIAYTTG
jgi:hypothetical protein